MLRGGTAAAIGAGSVPEPALDRLRDEAQLEQRAPGPEPPAAVLRLLRKRA